MRRLIAVMLATAMGLASAPAYAQSGPDQPSGQSSHHVSSQVSDHVKGQQATGTDAFGQAPPTLTDQQLLIGGLALGGLGGIIAIVANQKKNNNNNSGPVSP
jgi:hypothetical protein